MRVALFLGLLAFLVACGPRYARETVFDQDGVQVVLRSQQADGKPVPRGFGHPAAISSVRLAHILSRIDVIRKEQGLPLISRKDDEEEREPAVPLEVLFGVSDALAAAFEKAGPDQEIVAMIQLRERRFGIFTHDRLTSFVSFMKDDRLHLYFSHVNWEIPRGSDTEVPEPFADQDSSSAGFRIVAGDAMESVGSRAVRVDWRSPLFRKPSAVRMTPGGRLMRRTILMESPEEESTPEPDEPDVPRVSAPEGAPGLSPEALRALADLEEARRRGELSEVEYQSHRRQILRGE